MQSIFECSKKMDFGYKIPIKNLINVCRNIFNLVFDIERREPLK